MKFLFRDQNLLGHIRGINRINSERLDQANDWFHSFLGSKLFNQPFIASDHATIIFDNSVVKRSRPYQIENRCLQFVDVCKLVDEVWRTYNQGSTMFSRGN